MLVLARGALGPRVDLGKFLREDEAVEISAALVGIVHGTSVTCPLHNWVISLETGKAQGADEGSVKTVPVRIENERLFIALGTVVEKAA